eukprot:gnl/Hemi2/15460_TR5202_c0_g1_i1.p1 gnl/Hemi2/15460_TR5202_c0_g1~~gnl/Hemi2/15460_TR5202_c0_g1_i1.p1  ORF type:complete len:426 (+),score=163.24 gnl/Hemi2/15460_TR5202_c0_g1_i1:52-1329(+)
MMQNDSRVLLRTNISGHMGLSGVYNHQKEVALNYSFIIDCVGGGDISANAKPLIKIVHPTVMTPSDLTRMFQGFEVTMILYTALELKLFEELEQQEDVFNLANKLNLSIRGVQILCDALWSIGLLEHGDSPDSYVNTQVASDHLVGSSGKPNYVGDVRKLIVGDHVWDAIRQLPAAVRNGGSLVESDDMMYARHKLAEEAALNNTYHDAQVAAQVTEIISPFALRRRPFQVLDVECGNGLSGFSLAQKFKHSTVVALDYPNVIEVARQAAVQMEVNTRIQFLEGDIFTAPLMGPYDCIVLSHGLHPFNEEQSTHILHRFSEVLKPTGRIVIVDSIAGVDENPSPALLSVRLLATRKEGEVHTLNWYQQLLVREGFTTPVVHQLTGLPEKALISSRNFVPVASSTKKPVLAKPKKVKDPLDPLSSL